MPTKLKRRLSLDTMDFSSTSAHTIKPEEDPISMKPGRTGHHSAINNNNNNNNYYSTDTFSTVLKTMVAGGIAGIVAKTSSAPMDRIKIIFQTDSIRKFTMRNAFTEGRRVVAEEGLHHLWRGNSATVVRVFPYAGIQFAAFDVFNKKFKILFKTSSSKDTLTLAHFAERMCSGSGAGVTAVVLTYPLDVIRARMAVQTNTIVYKGLIQAIQTMVQNEGLPSLWSGLRPTVIGIIPYAGLAFTGFHSIKSVVEKNGHEFKWWHKLLAGGFAGLVAQTCTYPFDVVRRRMQTERFLLDVTHKKVSTIIEAEPKLSMSLGARRTWRGGGIEDKVPDIRYSGIMQTLRTIFEEEGIRGLFKGVQMNWIKGPMAVGISFTVNDLVLKWANNRWPTHEIDDDIEDEARRPASSSWPRRLGEKQ
jgi:solute carrier family 25 protein 42